MTSTRPYILRAIYAWIVDNGLTPHLMVETSDPRVRVPEAHIENGVIVLNVSLGAVRELELGNEFVTFHARFNGKSHSIVAPCESIQAIYARENGQGIFLGEADSEPTDPAESQTDPRPSAKENDDNSGRPRAPHLTIVK
jgi:stringent starvation protein B